MDVKNLLDVFDCEMQCEYKGRIYVVRDNGAIERLPKDSCKPSRLDYIWTFGKKDPKTGYMMFTGNVRVHQVVCTAFYGIYLGRLITRPHCGQIACYSPKNKNSAPASHYIVRCLEINWAPTGRVGKC